MADPVNTAPSTSYSDPIYDRLDTVAQRMSRRWPLVVLAIAAAIAVAVGIRMYLHNNPEAKSARAFVEAMGSAENIRQAELQKVVDDESLTAFFRARAACELAQLAIEAGRPAEAKRQAQNAYDLAKQSEDDGVQLDAKLSIAAADEETGDTEAALSVYQEVARSAGGRYPNQQLLGLIGTARAQAKLGHEQEAIETLESVIGRNDPGGETLISIARINYWKLKNKLGGISATKKDDAGEEKPADGEKGEEGEKAVEAGKEE
jgi:hypothetical protein